MTEITIIKEPINLVALIEEIPTKLKIKGICQVAKNKEGKYSISQIIMYKPKMRVVAVGYENCSHIMGNIAYFKQQRLGNIYSKEILECLNLPISL